jgi:hypothetical protein
VNPVEGEVDKRVEAQIRPALDLYEERNKLAFLYYKLPLDKLKELNRLVRELSAGDLERVLAYAQGLAEWAAPESQCGDAPNPPRSGT